MIARKLALVCQIALFVCLLSFSAGARAGYYIEYMNEPNVVYDLYDTPSAHHRHHAGYHHRYARHRHARSSATLAVYYFWDVYPNYCCDRCVECVDRCATSRCDEPSHRVYSDNPPHYRESEYNSTYYRAARDYDTVTADDMSRTDW